MPRKSKTSVSRAESYHGIGEFWDEHDVDDFWETTKGVGFTVQIESEMIYYPIEKEFSERVQSLAKKQGVSSATLVNLWIQEKLQQHG